jgi:hypothetical protein
MFNQNVYHETYNIDMFNIIDGLPPIFQLKNLFGSSLLTTSPFLTDTEFPDMDDKTQLKYGDGCIELCKKMKSDYLLIKTRLTELADIFSPRLKVTKGFVTTILDISKGENYVWRDLLNGFVRNQVRKGYKFKPGVKYGREELLKDFYHVFVVTQTQLGTPVHSFKYFSKIIGYHHSAKFFVLYLFDKPVSTALLLIKDNILYHPYTGTIQKYKPTAVNSVLYWEIIKYGIENKCTLFDMGRSFKDSGVARYKRKWGGREIQLYYCYYLYKRKSVPRYDTKRMKFLTTLWKNFMPLSIAEKIGHIFIRSVP